MRAMNTLQKDRRKIHNNSFVSTIDVGSEFFNLVANICLVEYELKC